jgi:hypothetical protein
VNGSPPRCGAQQPGDVPEPFDWWLFGGIAAAGGALAWIYSNGVPLANQLIHLLSGSGPLLPGIGITAAAAGALAVLLLVAYYLFQADGCIVSKPKSEPVCASGIVEATMDLSSTAVLLLAPFAVGPAGVFDVVVKSQYWYLTTTNAYWVYCSGAGAAMLRCIVKSEISCGARIGAMVGATAGAVAGIALGYLAGAAIASLACGPFAWLCFLLALIVAALVAAAITYVGAMLGGYAGAAIASAGADPVGDAWESLEPGAIVTVRGDWTRNPEVGNNELFFTTAINRTGPFPRGPSYTTGDADSTAPDDCPAVPPPPHIG